MADDFSASGNVLPTCDIVIPVHNAAHWLDWCMDEVIRHDSYLIGRILLVDDASEPEQSDLIRQIALRSPKASYVQTPGPEHGFGVACNFGATLSSAPCLLFLNTDCLLTEGCVESLLTPIIDDASIVLSCPVSNNSPELTYPMIPGYSYVDMNRLCRKAAIGQPAENIALDACTVVGNCLMVSRAFFERAGGFDAVWGKGYGEETDLHMKAFSMGLRGVAVLDAYVYHYGSGTFRHEVEQEQLKKRNHALFMSKWSREYRLLARHCAKHPPIPQLEKNIRSVSQESGPLELDVLFYLPALKQSIGGIHAVVGICNALIRAGIRACCAIVGEIEQSGSNAYQEPLLFSFLHYPSPQHFLVDRKLAPRIVVSTLFTTAPVVNQYALARNAVHVQFVQGYEAYFEGGRCFSKFIETLRIGNTFITTSRWLEEMIGRHLPERAALVRLPLGINRFIFYPAVRDNQTAPDNPTVIGAALRGAQDKGQGIVLEVFDRLITGNGNHHAVIFRSAAYSIPAWWPQDKYTIVDLPADQETIARNLRKIQVFFDASSHEGFGLMPLEALACGCRVVCSDSGGILDFVRDGENGYIVSGPSDPEVYVQKINACQDLPPPGFDDEFDSRHSHARYVAQISELVTLAAPHDKESWRNLVAKIPNLPLSVRFRGMLMIAYRSMKPYFPKKVDLVIKALFAK